MQEILSFELRLILAILTCYRLARMIANDDGPLFLFKRVRYWAKDKAYYEALAVNEVEPGPDSPVYVFDKVTDRHFGKWHNLAKGLSCPYCVGVWLSLPIFALVLWPGYYTDLFLLLMAISGGQAFLQSLGKE